MSVLNQSKQRGGKEGVLPDEQVTAHFADKLSALDGGIEDMEAKRTSSYRKQWKSNGVIKQVILTNNKFPRCFVKFIYSKVKIWKLIFAYKSKMSSFDIPQDFAARPCEMVLFKI